MESIHLPIVAAGEQTFEQNGNGDKNGSCNSGKNLVDLDTQEFFASTPFNRSLNRGHGNEVNEQDLNGAGSSTSTTQSHAASSPSVPVGLDGYGTIMNRGESLVKSLNILARIRRIDQENLRLGKGNGMHQVHSKKGSAANKKREEKLETTAFIYTNDMFYTSNPKAFQHVTHFLFEMLDSSETENVFRSCWPVYDKKQEPEYRRAAFTWATRIIEENREFFPHVQLQFSLFISPFGDRFLRFINFFAQFIMYTVAQRRKKPIANPSLCDKPNYNSTSEEKRIQIQNFRLARVELLQKSKTKLESTMFAIEKHSEKKSKYAKSKEDTENLLLNEKIKLSEVIQGQPHLFPEDVSELMETRVQKIQNDARNIDWDPASCSITEDCLATVVTREWTQKLLQLNNTFKKVEEFCNKHVKLCKLVESVEENRNIVLDGSKLVGLDKHNPDLGQYFHNTGKAIESLCCKAEEVDSPSDELMESMRMQLNRESFVSHRRTLSNFSESLSTSQLDNTMTTFDEEHLGQELNFETKALQMKLDGVKWDRLSKCDSNAYPENLFTWTPAKTVDLVSDIKASIAACSKRSESEATPKGRMYLGIPK